MPCTRLDVVPGSQEALHWRPSTHIGISLDPHIRIAIKRYSVKWRLLLNGHSRRMQPQERNLRMVIPKLERLKGELLHT